MQADRIKTETIRYAYRAGTAAAEGSFRSAMEQAVNAPSGLVPTGTQQVMDAWNAAKAETGIDPLPLNRISTAMLLHVENGRQEPFLSFLGSSAASAAQRAEQIVFRLQHPIAPVSDVQFAKDELAFYQCFLEKLAEGETAARNRSLPQRPQQTPFAL